MPDPPPFALDLRDMPADPVHVVTILNYPPDDRVGRMTYAFLDSVVSHGADRVTVLYEDHRPTIAPEHRDRAAIDVRQGRSHDVGHRHFNLRFKLPNLAAIDEPFLFLDADTYVLGDLRELWAKRHAKPWVGIDHQWVPTDPRTHREPFLNSGVQLVSDPAIYDLDAILAAQNAVVQLSRVTDANKRQSFACPGNDQALLYRYFRTIGYDYRHPEVGASWNSCAGVTESHRENGVWKARTVGLTETYDVNLIHYWSQFKPWAIGCPIYESYATREPSHGGTTPPAQGNQTERGA